MEIRIITPSTGLRNKIDWENQKDRIYYVGKSEKQLYEDKGLTVIEMPDGLCRSQARKFIVENETKPFFMIDDDVPYFLLWEYKEKAISKKISVLEACQLLSEKIIEFNIQDRAMVDFGNSYARFQCKNKPKFSPCSFVHKAFYVNPKILKQLNINYCDFDCQDDLEICLRLWEVGNYPMRYSLTTPYLRFHKEEDSITWKNNKRTRIVCDSYLRWGKIITLVPSGNTKEKVIGAINCAVNLLKKIIKNQGYNWDKTPDPVIKKLIEEKKYNELYDLIKQGEL